MFFSCGTPVVDEAFSNVRVSTLDGLRLTTESFDLAWKETVANMQRPLMGPSDFRTFREYQAYDLFGAVLPPRLMEELEAGGMRNEGAEPWTTEEMLVIYRRHHE